MQQVEYEVDLDAAEATLSAIEEQLESDSPVMQAEGAHKFRRLSRNHFIYTSTEGSRLLPTVVALLEAPSRDVRTAAAMAMADFGVHPEGREILRREGAIRPLVLLLGEGIESPAAEQAAKALMTLAASDINKDAIRQAEAIPALLGLLQAALARPSVSEAAAIKAVPAAHSHSIFGTPSASPRTGPESSRGRPNRLSKPAAAHTAGAIMNLQMNAQNRIALEQAGALGILQSILDTGVENVATDRAKYILTWMTVGADQDDFRAPKGEKTFDELLRDSHLIVEPTDEVTAAKPIAPAVKPVAPSKLSKIALEPKRLNGKKVSQTKEPEFKVQRPWGGYHTAA
ncbi:hypothetical protein ABBQ38_007030 [Trebouxia sp. C0009 RCD-2024]